MERTSASFRFPGSPKSKSDHRNKKIANRRLLPLIFQSDRLLGKNALLPCTTATFTSTTEPWTSLCRASSSRRVGLFM